jgi:hypothetical protein
LVQIFGKLKFYLFEILLGFNSALKWKK